MKYTTKLAALAGLIAMGAAQSYAQSTNVVTTTNSVIAETLNVSLSGFVQNPNSNPNVLAVKSVRISSKDIIKLLGTFASNAKLMILTPVGGGTPTVIVRETSGRVNTDTDVSSAFGITTGQPIEQSKTSASGKTTGVQYSIDTFSFMPNTDTNGVPVGTSFTVQGFTSSQLPNGNFNSQVNGNGTVDDVPAVLKGTITGSGGKTENVVVTTP